MSVNCFWDFKFQFNAMEGNPLCCIYFANAMTLNTNIIPPPSESSIIEILPVKRSFIVFLVITSFSVLQTRSNIFIVLFVFLVTNWLQIKEVPKSSRRPTSVNRQHGILDRLYLAFSLKQNFDRKSISFLKTLNNLWVKIMRDDTLEIVSLPSLLRLHEPMSDLNL